MKIMTFSSLHIFTAPSPARTKPSEQLPDREGTFYFFFLGTWSMANHVFFYFRGFMGFALGFHLILSDLRWIYPWIYQRDGTGHQPLAMEQFMEAKRAMNHELWHPWIPGRCVIEPAHFMFHNHRCLNGLWTHNDSSIGNNGLSWAHRVHKCGFGLIQSWFIMALRQHIPRPNFADVLTNTASQQMAKITMLSNALNSPIA